MFTPTLIRCSLFVNSEQISQPTLNCPHSAIKTLEKGVKYF